MPKRKADKTASSTIDKKVPRRDQCFLSKYKQTPGIVESAKGATFARCEYCDCDFSISHSGTFDIGRHCAGKEHKDRVEIKKSAAGCSKMDHYLISKSVTPGEENVIKAEVLMTEFIVKMNLPLSAADTLSKN
jgi:hypothetical protein